MKGLEKLTSIRLAEVLTQKSVIPNEIITDALYSQDRYGEPFVNVLVSGEHITEWDLAKLVVESFQIPFLMASCYEVTDEVKDRIPKEDLFENLIVPIDVFDNIVTVAMPILISFEVLAKLKKKANVHIYPYVGLISENKKVLGDLFDDFGEWSKNAEATRTKRIADQRKQEHDSSDWMNIFDTGDAQVRDALGGK